MKRKTSRKRRSVKRKTSRKRRSVKQKMSRCIEECMKAGVKKKSRKRRSVKRKVSRKRRSAKRKVSRKRRSVKRKNKFRILPPWKESPDGEIRKGEKIIKAKNLHEAIEMGDTQQVVKFLENPNTDVNALDGEGVTPLMMAIMDVKHRGIMSQRTPGIINMLINFVDLNAKDRDWGRTALHWAVKLDRPEAVEKLLQQPGIDPTIKNKSGLTPLDMALKLKVMNQFLKVYFKFNNTGAYLTMRFNEKPEEAAREFCDEHGLDRSNVEPIAQELRKRLPSVKASMEANAKIIRKLKNKLGQTRTFKERFRMSKKKSRKPRSAKRKVSRKRRSAKRKGNKKLKFRMITKSEKKQIEKEDLTCPICMNELKDANNKDIVGCMGAKNIPGWTCCSKTKKTGGCKNVYFHKKCLETWKKSQKARHQEPSCPNCRAKQAPPPSRGRGRPMIPAALLASGAALGATHGFYQGFTSVPTLKPCYNREIDSLGGKGLPTCNKCNVVKSTSDGDLTWHYPYGPPGGVCPQYFDDSWTNWHANMDAKKWRELAGIGIEAEVSQEKL